MSKALSFIGLDTITVKPYLTLKNLAIFGGGALVIMLVSKSGGASIGMLLALASVYASYPFAIGDKSGIDILYRTLSIPLKTVVFGRYLFALAVDIAAGLFALVATAILLAFTQSGFDLAESLVTTMVLLVFFSLTQAIQLPIYFKLGYTKAKLLAYLPYVVLPLIILGFSNALQGFFGLEQIAGLIGWISANVLIVVLVSVAVWLAVIAVSIQASLAFYSKRDF